MPVREEMKRLEIEQYETMQEALAAAPKNNRVFMEPTGRKSMRELPARGEDMVLILGSSSTSNASHTTPEESYRIEEPCMSDMYQTCAAAVALAYRYGQ